jgi:hypothetical protein
MKLLNIIISALLIICWSSLSAQTHISIDAVTDTSIAGKEIELIVELPSDRNFNSISLLLIETKGIDHIEDSAIYVKDLINRDFEISDFGQWIGNNNVINFEDENAPYKNTLSIRIWDEGSFYLIPVPDDKSEIYISDVDDFPLIHVLSMIDPDDPDETLAPIKDIIKQKKEFYDHISWYHFLILIIPLVILLIWLNKKMKNKKEIAIKKEIEDPVIPYIDALNKLNELKSEKIWLQGRVKEFHQQLTFILREYLHRKYGFNALEQSTTEIRNTINIHIDDKKHIDTISDILQISDLVKFARAKVEEDLNEKFLNKTIGLINILK